MSTNLMIQFPLVYKASTQLLMFVNSVLILHGMHTQNTFRIFVHVPDFTYIQYMKNN